MRLYVFGLTQFFRLLPRRLRVALSAYFPLRPRGAFQILNKKEILLMLVTGLALSPAGLTSV